MNMAKHMLRLKGDCVLSCDGYDTICPHNALFQYKDQFNYHRVLKDGSLSREVYFIPFELSANEELFEELND